MEGESAVSTSGPVRVLDKAIDVLESLATAPQTAAQLAERIDEPRSTVYRLLRGLALRDLVEEADRDGVYQLGTGLFSLGSQVAKRFDALRDNAYPVMVELNEATAQTVFLVTRSGLRGTCVERIDGQQVQVMILPRGGSVPLHGGSASRVLLAFAPPAVQEQFLAQAEIERFTARTPDVDALRREIAEIRARGYSVSSDDVVPGIAAVGAPIRGRDGAVIAAVSVTGPEPSILGEETATNVARVLDAASRISVASGYRG